MKKRLVYLILPIITLILEIIPYGVVLRFGRPYMNGEIGYFKEYYSYFDMMPFGYGHFFPFITAWITCLILLLMVFYCVKGSQGVAIAVKAILSFVIFISIFPYFFMGIEYVTLVGSLITSTLIAQVLLMQFFKIK